MHIGTLLRAWRVSAQVRCSGASTALSVPARRCRSSIHCAKNAMSADSKPQVKFGNFDIQVSEIFSETALSFAFVNLKPVVPGHLLVSPRRIVPRFVELTSEEVSDLWNLAQRVGKAAETHFKAESLTFAIQDGPQAGQTVPHVHIHILPRRAGDFAQNDEVYDAIDKGSKQMAGERVDFDKERQVRTHEEMAAEAAELRPLIN